MSDERPRRCRCTILFADDFGDNTTTFHCEFLQAHTGPHQESGKNYSNAYAIRWQRGKLRETVTKESTQHPGSLVGVGREDNGHCVQAGEGGGSCPVE